jgi:hypothetical protein
VSWSATSSRWCASRDRAPTACPELHKLTPALAVLQGKGFKVALVTDGAMSGASGKVPAAIHVSPEVLAGGALGKVRDGDVIRLDAVAGTPERAGRRGRVGRARRGRALARAARRQRHGLGRELFGGMRRNVLQRRGRRRAPGSDPTIHDASMNTLELASTARSFPSSSSTASKTPCRWRRRWSPAACACSR